MRALLAISVCILASLLPAAECQDEPPCDLPVDLALVVDLSASVSRADLARVKIFLKTIVDSINFRSARMALVTFNDQPKMERDLDDCRNNRCVNNAIDGMSQTGGGTDIEGALRFVDSDVFSSSRGDRSSYEDVILLVTDGSPTPKAVDPALLRRLKVTRDMRIVVVAVGQDADSDQVFDVATTPFYENVFFANNYLDLSRVAGDMTELYCVEGLSRPPPDSLLPSSCVYDIGLLVDLSGSIIENKPFYDNWIQLREFLKAFIRQVKERFPNVNIALEFFRNRGNIVFNFKDCSTYECMHEKMKKLPVPWGSTYMKDAFVTMEEEIIRGAQNRPNVDDLIILLTDGFPSRQDQVPTEVAERLKEDGTRIYGIGVTAEVNQTTMRGVVSSPFSQNYEPAENYRKMARRINDIIAKTCRVPKEACEIEADIAVLVDLSASVAAVGGGFERLKEIVSGIADNIIFPNAQMAIVHFSGDATTYVRLNRCRNSACIRRFVSNLPAPSGQTNIESAFDKVVNEVFVDAAGDRASAPNIIILVTDGAPTVQSAAGRAALQQAQADPNTRIIALPVSNDADVSYIYEIASKPLSENVLFSYSFVDLVDNLHKVKDMICYEPVAPPTPLPEPQICDYDIALLVDVSGSIFFYGTKANNLVILRRFLANFIRRLKALSRGDVNVAVEYFSTDAEVLTFFDSCNNNMDVDCIVNSLWRLPKDPNAKTNMKKGFEVMRDEVFRKRGDRPNVNDLIILVSDGFPEPFAPNNPLSVTTQIKNMGIRIMGVGVTDRVNDTIMEQVVSDPPGDNFVRVEDFPALEQAVGNLLIKSCKPVRKIRPCKGDIVFLLDSSGSQSVDDFETMKKFVSQLTRRLPVSQSQVRVGGINFSTRFTPLFQLKDYDSQTEVELSIRDAEYMAEDTHTWEVLPYIENTMFSAANGDRPGYPNYLVIFTDGGSQEPRSTIAAAKTMKDKANCTVVQIGSKFDMNELRALTSNPISKNLILINSFATLERKVDYTMNEILDTMCDEEEIVVECPPETCPRRGEPEVENGVCVCICREGRQKYKCSQ